MKVQPSGKKRKGFTLAELMVVIVIIGLLATLVSTDVMGIFADAKWKKVKADIRTIDEAVEIFTMRNNGRYPDSLEDLITPDINGHKFLKRSTLPKDPWDNEYGYDPPSPGEDYRVYTLGADGVPGGEGDDRDYTSQDLNNE